MAPPPFTVVVPTRERADVLVHCLATLVQQDYEPLRIVVSDNCSQDHTREVVESFADPRIRYLNTGTRLSMSDNWEFALGHVETGWLTILGDDDGLLPDSLVRAGEIVVTTGVSAIRSSVCAYQWPSLTGEGFGRISIPTGTRVHLRDSRDWIEKVMAARASYLDLPMLYNGGFVDLAVLAQLRARAGRLYRSCIPDVYMAFAIASLIERYAFSEAPLAINGASRHSTGTSQFSGRQRAGESPAARFLSEGNLPFHPDLPLMPDGHYPPSFQVLVYESWLQTRDLRGDGETNRHAEQLSLVLANRGRYRDEMLDWGRRFAASHGIDFEAARRRADRLKLRRRPASMYRKLTRKRGMVEAGSTADPIGDVAAAARYVGELSKKYMSKGT